MLRRLFRDRQRQVAEQALRSRANRTALKVAWAAVILYNVIGLLDIYSTTAGLSLGVGEEANPLIKAAMLHLGPGWIAAKLALQLLISCMVLWFPHRVVIGIFLAAVAFNASVVYGNLRIAGLF